MMSPKFQFQALRVFALIGVVAIGLLLLAAFSSVFSRSSVDTLPKLDLHWTWDGPGAKSHEYKFTFKKLGLWSAMGVAGALWGGREAYHADPGVFQNKWGVSPKSFFGANAWERNYEGNSYLNADGLPNPHKPEWGNSFRDYWHASGAASRVLWFGAAFSIGAGQKQKLKHKLLDILIGSVISSTAGWAAYNYLRYW